MADAPDPTNPPDDPNLSDEQRMQLLRAQAVAIMNKFNTEHPGAGGQAYIRGENGVRLINPDGTIQSDTAVMDPKTQMYVPAPRPTSKAPAPSVVDKKASDARALAAKMRNAPSS